MPDNRRLVFITHADVVIDPLVPVPRWPLSEKGRARHAAFNQNALVNDITAVYASDEQKAMDGGSILADHLGLPLHIRPKLHENDRSSTGYLPPDKFWPVVERFFAEPERSIDGWERAIDAQSRIVAAIAEIFTIDETTGTLAVVAHGGVGSLLMAHCLQVPIARKHGASVPNGGAFFTLNNRWQVLTQWADIS